MENKFIFLSTCSTCKKIINILGIENKSFLQDVKHKILSKNQLDFLYNYTKSYEALINKRGLAQIFKRERKNLSNYHEGKNLSRVFRHHIIYRYVFSNISIKMTNIYFTNL